MNVNSVIETCLSISSIESAESVVQLIESGMMDVKPLVKNHPERAWIQFLLNGIYKQNKRIDFIIAQKKIA